MMKESEKMRNEKERWNIKRVMRNEYEEVFFFLIKEKMYKFSKKKLDLRKKFLN